MKNRKCPIHKNCWDYRDGSCGNCEIGKCIDKLHRKIDRLKAENQKLNAEKEELNIRIDVLLHPNF